MYNNNNIPAFINQGLVQGYNKQRGYASGYNPNNRVMRKRSGAKIKIIDGNPFISAWKKNKLGFFTLYARPCKNTKDIQSKNGKNWLNLFVTIVNRSTMQESKCSAMYDVDRRRLYLKEFNQIVTTNGKGGYWGRHIGGQRR